ncbi:FAS1-like dehydratase domain-containing protein [Micromonospora aurantiaca (nom. illeg.)]|uniref:FAS1-like dehydratase domain-containing protein n=1 Tax=Micromonospora aurantiaca (nom. illeg.) TaxID=47850 RepID=UPI003F49C5FE
MSGPDTDGGTGTDRRFPVDGPYLVGREQVRVFAAVLGERDPVCHDLTAARRRGFLDLVAPPSFAAVLTLPADLLVLGGLAPAVEPDHVVHAGQDFRHHRPIVAGDLLRVVVRLTGVRRVRGSRVATTRAVVVDSASEVVTTSTATYVLRH